MPRYLLCGLLISAVAILKEPISTQFLDPQKTKNPSSGSRRWVCMSRDDLKSTTRALPAPLKWLATSGCSSGSGARSWGREYVGAAPSRSRTESPFAGGGAARGHSSGHRPVGLIASHPETGRGPRVSIEIWQLCVVAPAILSVSPALWPTIAGPTERRRNDPGPHPRRQRETNCL